MPCLKQEHILSSPKITSSFHRISQTIDKMPAGKDMLELAQRQRGGAQLGGVGCMLKEFFANVQKNAQKLPQGLQTPTCD